MPDFVLKWKVHQDAFNAVLTSCWLWQWIRIGWAQHKFGKTKGWA